MSAKMTGNQKALPKPVRDQQAEQLLSSDKLFTTNMSVVSDEHELLDSLDPFEC